MTGKRVEQQRVTQMFGEVLVPTDFSEYFKKTHFILHHDHRDTGSRPPAYCRCPPAHQARGTHEAHSENARIPLEEGGKFLEHPGFIVRGTVDAIASGDIPTAILTKAGYENVSSIVIGSRGRGLVKGLLPGSVSADILRNGKTHLLIFRHRFAGELEGAVFSRFCPGIFTRILFPTGFLRTCKKGAVINKG